MGLIWPDALDPKDQFYRKMRDTNGHLGWMEMMVQMPV